MIEIQLSYEHLGHIQYYLKMNDIVCWLIDNKIEFEVISKFQTSDLPTGVLVHNDEDATAVKLKFNV